MSGTPVHQMRGIKGQFGKYCSPILVMALHPHQADVLRRMLIGQDFQSCSTPEIRSWMWARHGPVQSHFRTLALSKTLLLRANLTGRFRFEISVKLLIVQLLASV